MLTVGACLGLLGCERWSGLRTNESKTDPAAVSDVDASVPRDSHSASGSPGTLSRQAQEIESHFNIR